MTSRERISLVMAGKLPDRVPMHDGYWDEALDRWEAEGLPAEVRADRDRLWEYFDMEIRQISIDPSFLLEERILGEDERYVSKQTRDGAVLKYIKGKTSTPGLESFRVGSRADWEALKPRLESIEGRLPADLPERYASYRQTGRYVVATIHDPIEASWSKLGPTCLMEAMGNDPCLVEDVFKTITEMNLAVLEDLLGQGYEVDGGWIWGDIAYSRGTFFSPAMYVRFLQPCHKRLVGFFTQRGLPVVYHSDGDLRRVMDLLIETGIRCLQPLEAKAGMDLFEMKRLYGDRLVFMGNIDFEAIARGEREAEAEIALKVGQGKQGGGYIYHSDHSVPPKVSLARYKRVLELVRQHGKY
ncbi:MAG TPA: uroporphyrinogen decarboxylase family protein [bacterium]|nr:uroporphyrinogen decarboxylase family protein [bacterium]